MTSCVSIDFAVGGALRRQRELHGFTQEALAELAEIAAVDLVSCEEGRRRITASEAFRLVRALGIEPADLYAGLARGGQPATEGCGSS